MTRLRFLLLEDSLLDAELTQASLAEGGIKCELCRVETREQFVATLAAESFDLILADYTLPAFDGIAALEIARSICPDVPFILVSATLGEELAVEALKSGATDYVLKQRLRRLVPAVQRALQEAQEQRGRKQAENVLQQVSDELERQLRKFDAIVAAIPDFIYTFDLVGRFTYISPALLKLLQKTSAEALGKNFVDLDYPSALAMRLQKQIQAVIETRQPLKDEMPYTNDLGTHAYEYIFVPLFNADGAVEAVAGVTRDITERKQAEEAMLEQSRLSALSAKIGSVLIQTDTLSDSLQQCTEALVHHLDAALARIWTLNQEKNVLELQASAGLYTHLDGAHSRVPVGQFKIGLIAQERQPHVTNHVIGDPRVHDQAWAAREGIVAFAGYPLIVEHQLVGVIAVFTRYWLSEITLQAIAAVTDTVSLGIQRKQVALERERLLAQEQAAREAAEAANRIKDEFLAVLSHELRSPLNPILGWTRLLQNGKLDATRQAEALATIERNTRLQAQLIEDLLDISRIMQGKLTLTAAPTSLTFVIAAAVETVQLAAEAKQIQIRLDLDQTLFPIAGDAARLQQVVWNLLTNAVKFTPNGGQIIVELRQLAQLAQIRVIDTGKGIKPQFLPHVFEYFRQEDGSTTRQFGGLGLGLAIVRQIVEMHGGTVAAASAGEDQGTTFIVQLPLMQQAIPLISEASRVQVENTAAPLSALQILVVDDNADARALQAFLLEQSGATVTAVASGLEALQVLDQCLPHVLVSDIGMAAMDGYMLMQQLRSRPPSRGGTIPAIALTAYAAESDQQKALQAGFQMHMTKPVEPEKLVGGILHLLKRQQL